MNLFNRIRNRAGAASFETRDQIRLIHKSTLEGLFIGLKECFSQISDSKIIEYL